MTEGASTILWTCDRCGAKETIKAPEQPRRWHRVHLASPPRAALDSDRVVRWDICGDCSEDIVSWRRGAPTVDSKWVMKG